jgi:GPI-anchor transamidase subunit T
MLRGAGMRAIPPTGGTFAVVWQPPVKPHHVESLWTGVTNAISGLVCTSLNTLASNARSTSPALLHPTSPAFPPVATAFAVREPESSVLLNTYGVLSQEALCTENLAGFIKLLPCREHAGFATFLKPDAVFGSPFHSISLEVEADMTGATSCAA